MNQLQEYEGPPAQQMFNRSFILYWWGAVYLLSLVYYMLLYATLSFDEILLEFIYIHAFKNISMSP